MHYKWTDACGQEKRAKAKALMKYEREVTNVPGKKKPEKKKPEEKREY
ncbi:MAG: hypothetical protein OEZ21_01335 [Candidatus Bathyarchaeota archaeon]|nr:hypothetical protein [Candidatus Bathyarchaeota archaeon]MDH5745586.1 hypothetical protein [Candidatus Bathyarchaeota archaeon]